MNQRFKKFTQRPVFILLLLGAVSLIAYGRLVIQPGLFGDDPQLLYAFHRYGSAGYQRVLGWSRPFGIWVYALFYPLLGEHIGLWQLSAILLRALCAWLLYRLLCQIKDKWRTPALWAALICLVYPGFSQQAHALQFLLHWAALSALLASQILMLRALEIGNKNKSVAVSLLSILLAALGICSTEYFIGLELLRLLFLWLTVRRDNQAKDSLVIVFKRWLPYLCVLAAFTGWRLFITDISYPRPLLLEGLAGDPGGALTNLLRRLPADIWKSTGLAWTSIFVLTDRGIEAWIYIGMGISISIIFTALLWRRNSTTGKAKIQVTKAFIGLGLLAMLAGGLPLWISETPLELSYPENRATLCLMVGACLLLAGLTQLLPWKAGLIIISILVGFSTTAQIATCQEYKRAWEQLVSFYRQLTNCAPGLESGTAILYEEPLIPSYPANSLSALLNWTYDPQNHSSDLSYDMLRVSERLGNALPALESGLPIRHGNFSGSTSKVLVITIDEESCLRILKANEVIDFEIPALIDQARYLTNMNVIHPDQVPVQLPEFMREQTESSDCSCD